MENSDQKWMAYLLDKAHRLTDVDVPIVGLVTYQGSLLFESENHREQYQTPFGHVEMDLIGKASDHFGSWRLMDTCLYVLIEPCLMCTGAIYAARIPRVVFGTVNPKGGALLHMQKYRKSLGLNHDPAVVHGFFEREIQSLLKNFFATKRNKN